ncbi:MAG: radical SAM protein [Candidatus Omnitrophica bacterium]|nr:radical SAM protein [Candidatus Omnitrophota bacterium]
MPLIDYLKHSPRLIYKKTETPSYLTFFVTNRCNASCDHCFFWKDLEKMEEKMDLGEIERVSKSMGNLLSILITGGEPFLRKDLPQIVRFFYENNNTQNIVVSTNGILTSQIVESTKQIVEQCEKAHVIVNLSFDAIGKDHDRIKKVEGCFDKAIATYEELRKLKPRHSNLNVGIVIAMHQLNEEGVRATYEYIRDELKPDSIALNLLRGNPKNPKLKEIDINNYDSLCQEMNQDILTQRLTGYSNFPLVEFTIANNMLIRDYVSKTYRTQCYQMPCYAALLNAVVYPNGDVVACEPLDKKLGNLKKTNYDFKKVWFSRKAIDLRKWIKDTKCFCTHECNLNTNILFNLRFLPKLLIGAAKIKWKRIQK